MFYTVKLTNTTSESTEFGYKLILFTSTELCHNNMMLGSHKIDLFMKGGVTFDIFVIVSVNL